MSRPEHGIRIGGDGPLCICGAWGCALAIGDLRTHGRRVRRTVIVLQSMVLWLLLVTLAVACTWGYRWLT